MVFEKILRAIQSVDPANIGYATGSKLANAALDAMREWQPISSAPLDGTPFLAWEGDERGPFKCWWHVNWQNEAYWMDHQDSEPNPTYWAPMPPPPAH